MFTSHAFAVLDKIGNAAVVSVNDQTASKGVKSSGTDLLRVPAPTPGAGSAHRQMTFSVESALDNHVAAIEEPRLPDGKWHPSSLYGCPRKAVYGVRGREATDPPDARSKRVFRVGHLFHQFIQDAVERQIGGSVRAAYREVPVEIPELNIVGHADGVVQFDSEVWELQEFKSISSKGFKFGGLPKIEHEGQTTPYLRALRDYGSPALGIPPLGDRLPRARLAYVSKDDMAISEHSVFWSDEKNAGLERRVESLEPYRASETALPARLPVEKGKRNWACGYCSFATRCWDQDGDVGEQEAVQRAA